jgi:lipopolysaccharide export system protein LptC
MSVAPMPVRAPAGSARMMGSSVRWRPPTPARIARRRFMVGVSKRLLPVVALGLLASVALYPEFERDSDRARISYRRGAAVEMESGVVVDARYRGVDERNRPYTMTASTAHQVTPERINLTDPKGDIVLENGSWLMLQSKQGVYIQHKGLLDLSGEVNLYRDDGTVMQTSSAAIDLKAGAAAGSEMTHTEGPFGTLDSQGFTMTDKGTVMHFAGPGRLVLNMRKNTAGAAAPAPNAGPGVGAAK